MSKDKIGDQDKLREMLIFFLKEMGATQVELSKGMGVSRPVVIDFLNRDKDYLPVSSEGLVNLCENLQKNRPSKRKLNKDSNDDESNLPPEKMRQKLGEIGADELLESAGFLPDQTESIRVTPERFFQIAQIVALLELLDFEDLLSTTKEFLATASNKLTIASTKWFDDYQDDDALQFHSTAQLTKGLLTLPVARGSCRCLFVQRLWLHSIYFLLPSLRLLCFTLSLYMLSYSVLTE